MSQAADFPYRRIVAEIRAEIAEGRRAPGDVLPSEHDLAQHYSASRTTVRRAIAALKAEGLVVSQQGKGAFVRPTPHVRLLLTGTSYRRHRGAGLAGFNAQVQEQGQTPAQQLLEVATVSSTSEVAEHLDLDVGAPVVTRRRLFLINEEPVAFCDSYYPASMAEGTPIAEPRLVKGGVHKVIEDPDGPIRRHIARSVDELASRMPTASEAELLRLPPGVPVVRVLRTIYDIDECPIEVQCTIAAADRHEFRYEVSMT